MAERYAIYYAPPATGALWERASQWLGRDAETGETFEGPVAGMERDRLLNFTGSPNRYGFHATLRSPVSLKPGFGRDEFDAVTSDIASAYRPLHLGPMKIAEFDGFLALVPVEAPAELENFAQACVEAVEPLRAPLTERELGRRLANPLDERQRELLDRYGYPYVAEQFFFHMTLTDQLDAEALPEIREVAEAWFAPVLDDLTLGSISVFVEPKPAQEFRRARDFALTGSAQ
ncbi:hypothetical protein GCM10007989_14650 [Devosia pacifica]|uniref:Phosphonate metabolism protein n=1 Tax=Devosia pacifica TaxID=1335967 RepID=A0A918S2E8_9HYPH|nr:DUF1045 domain-containing protein [Devosia pacifica]GHA20606.1 hypothetical protein GCM10007989_14650 [Devosia pacifica]